MTVIVKEKAVFVKLKKQWLNLAQARTIALSGDKVVICWNSGQYQGFDREESQEIINTLEALRK